MLAGEIRRHWICFAKSWNYCGGDYVTDLSSAGKKKGKMSDKVKLKVKDIVKLFSELDPEQSLDSSDGDLLEPFVLGFIDGIRDQDFNVWAFHCPYDNQVQIEIYRSMFQLGESLNFYKSGKNSIDYVSTIQKEFSSKMRTELTRSLDGE